MTTTNTLLHFQSSSEHFQSVTRLRLSVYPEMSATDELDLVSDHYLLVVSEKPQIAMRVGQAKRSKLDCEEYYPKGLLARRDSVCSASRLVRAVGASDPSLVRTFLKDIRKLQYENGMRIDVINVREPMVPYYLLLGYRLVCNSAFVHPRLGTASRVMVLALDVELVGLTICAGSAECRRARYRCESAT